MTPTIPTPGTLNKYGLSRDAFISLLASQGGVCAVCKAIPKGHWCIDHEHVKGWKKLPSEKRVKYVRGILCWRCNYYYACRGITVERALNLADYLRRYEFRKEQS